MRTFAAATAAEAPAARTAPEVARTSAATAEASALSFAVRRGLIFRTGMGHRFARQVDAALLVNFDDFDLELLAFFHDVFGLLDEVVGQLAHSDQTFFARHDLDENADAHDPGDF